MLWLTSWTGQEDVRLAAFGRGTTATSDWANVAEDLVQGDFIRDAASQPKGNMEEAADRAVAAGPLGEGGEKDPDGVPPVGEEQGTGAGTLVVNDSCFEEKEEEGLAQRRRGVSGEEKGGGDGGLSPNSHPRELVMSKSGRMTVEDMEVKRQMSELEAEDERMVAPKWWGTVSRGSTG